MELHRERSPENRTPIADALIKLSSQCSSSFHALPIGGARSVAGSPVAEKYEKIFGAQYLHNELTITGSHFDSFFFSQRAIKEAEGMAAALYGADGTFFVTAGTTVSNQIALDALYKEGMRVLLDKGCHQSLHFGLHRCNASIDYLQPAWNCKYSAKSMWSISDLLAQTLQAQNDGQAYDMLILNAHSYDGIVYDVPRIIRYLLENGVNIRTFLIDEAWGASNYFNSKLKHMTAMAAKPLLAHYPDLQIVSTQSAHKSLSCLRQSSMIHYCGGRELGETLRLSRFRLHTTSPSYPILASLDLARAQMQAEGEALTARANMLAERFRTILEDCSILSTSLQKEASFPDEPIQYAHVDPTKVSVNMEAIGLSAAEVKEKLFQEYGIYINRNTDTSLLLNFHIGVKEQCVTNLLQALREITSVGKWLHDASSTSFIIPYPPGVPLVVPGETITPAIEKQIRVIQRSGAHVFYA